MENIYDPACDTEDPEMTEDEIIEAMEDIAAAVADQRGQWTPNQAQKYKRLKSLEGRLS